MNLDEIVEQAIQLNKKADALGEEIIFAEADLAVDHMLADPSEEGLSGVPGSIKKSMPALVTTGKTVSQKDFLNKQRGREFVEKFSELIKADLCKPDSQLRKWVDIGAEWSLTAIVTAVIVSLSVPLAASVIVPVAVYIYRQGLTAYCALDG